jgi:osmotically-inducible protein OsmY
LPKKRYTDEKIKKDVVETIYWDSRVDASDVLVEVKDREVVLRGTVPSFSAKEAILFDAWRIPGVKKVDNHVFVKYPDAIETPSDSELRSMAKNVLAWNDSTKLQQIDVKVDDRVITLNGSVDAYWKKFRAYQLVSGVNGVMDILNKITVVPTKSVVDTAIAEDVAKALERSYHVAADQVDIRVKDGVVTLSGFVPNRAMCEAALAAAQVTFGVKDIVDRMVVEGPEEK